MGGWTSIFGNRQGGAVRRLYEESRRLLPSYSSDEIASALPSKEVTKVALRLKYLIEQVIPFELERSAITKPNSDIITAEVIQTAKRAGGDEYRACVIYCLLVCHRWFKQQGEEELWRAGLLECRALACEVIAGHIIETEEDQDYLLREALLKRYSIFRKGEETHPINVVERAVDIHALRIIGSSGYQKCIKYLWRGWYSQDARDPSRFVEYKEKDNTSYWAHFRPERMRTPVYQNAVLIFFSLLYLALYTAVINTVNPSGDLDIAEAILYTMTMSYLCDEITKFWKIGRHYLGFWNVFNLTLYTLLAVSFILRMVALAHSSDVNDEQRRHFNRLSYNFLAFAAPMFWMRLLLFLDTFRFFGAMLVVLEVMMKESIIFFALLFFVLIGFLQAFVGMNETNFGVPITGSIVQGMANSIMQSPNFELFQDFAPPFGIVLYYLFNFVVMVLLLNILIALYNSSYSDISGNADDEFMALFSRKTLQFVRAPDENVFIPPFNLIEILFISAPFEWWLSKESYERLNHYVMGIIYSPLLLITAWIETREARRIRRNRRRGEEDDTIQQEWEELAAEVDFDVAGTDWEQAVQESKPNVEVSACVLEIRQLKEQVRTLMETVKGIYSSRAVRRVVLLSTRQ
ncbi:Potassium ion channel Yvc1 [Rasamsonia emersonii CBS 393.64]|uniref:Potassium ion channel Yvc1 n=1 Tax=Rasamsonia emersonii (strain ATCC 16479 / CBS 393.64 / IMI 116815) TaxID=1408163 RepID=A0A0F4Z385_RASE3|nr:Potassium ion channel Yvc1 [Rasamsonia emersonii CBS 393.64]KKA24333.1 Potassium ion channel Yvc1 [Rasamsonia emersonii CBS 393.64]